ncbi:uncharacterized protein LACBIDRAFT_322387 [Laccaria bicolor S238N-H82]|uniref:Predicted protein n=1 Tax=Laccaria bicolor (strain S238N-H82 / ATCC MYA-4686) TaxID=486041 RepID=B0CW44_LACBS|nr:uncharacterized protein LACBIDRAFT_322387 [Laccaria bicolor S238N-H82]EDR13446.1 predicted protein [Laccaria bicolor S238N-H82]|eukprot:XP_001875944.1 predicted protein [Laccaria bicolor S238N-H82]
MTTYSNNQQPPMNTNSDKCPQRPPTTMDRQQRMAHDNDQRAQAPTVLGCHDTVHTPFLWAPQSVVTETKYLSSLSRRVQLSQVATTFIIKLRYLPIELLGVFIAFFIINGIFGTFIAFFIINPV